MGAFSHSLGGSHENKRTDRRVGNAVRQDKPIRCHTRLGHAGYNVPSYKSLGPEESTKSLRSLNGDAMQVKLKNITGIASPKVEQFDLHEEFGVAYLEEVGERVTLTLNQTAFRSWLKQEHPHIVNIKWFYFNTVILYYDGIGAAIVSRESWNNIRLGAVDKLFVSNSYIFVSYDEESLYGSRPGELESNIMSVFLRDGTFEFGIGELMDKDAIPGNSMTSRRAILMMITLCSYVMSATLSGLWMSLNEPGKRSHSRLKWPGLTF